MKEFRDCKGRIACKGDPKTGFLEVLYKRCRTSTILNVGGTFKIEREGVVTKITRKCSNEFSVNSYVA
ncbi:hypothetical protein [Globicatella sulfidifaciens]|uniref:Uncharacterized protein n=1 Tax=Globicatella sulfidifaciens TaxID=136093 RepID=A0A7X8C5N6_9LACT|nr:hypothetical protein [Globicatella sulfidifaciens]NLJ19457.1 hypothetical protein [Globicatella sulfidifaciens]